MPASQSYQLSFSITVVLLFIAILVSILLLGAAVKAFGTVGSFSRKYIQGKDTSNRQSRKHTLNGDRNTEE